MPGFRPLLLNAACVLACASLVHAQGRSAPALRQDPNTWVKRSPLAQGPASPTLGYEGDCRWDSVHGFLIRYGGHNQGGGGEQGSEIWTFDPPSSKWELRQPNTSPPGVCCAQQNVFDPVDARYLRFPAFSASHGWQWHREVYLNDWSVWTYDPEANLWRNLRPVPSPTLRPLRCASWDEEHQVVVVFGGEGSREGTLVYDPHANEWTRMKPAREPEPRSGGNLAYDSRRGRHLLFGSQFSDDPHLWSYDLRDNAWTDLRPPSLPPTDRNDAVLTYDPGHDVLIALVKITTGKGDDARHRLETWTHDGKTNRWTKMNPPREPDASGNRARQLVFVPSLNVALLENRIGEPREQQIWTYRFGRSPQVATPTPPKNLRMDVGRDGAVLTWMASPSAERSGYSVFRGQGVKPWEVQLRRVARLPAEATTWTDPQVEPGVVYHYRIRARGPGETEGPASRSVRTRPPRVEDLLVSVESARRVTIRWEPTAGDRGRDLAEDLTGYFVERAPVEVLSDDELGRLKRKVKPLERPSVGAIVAIGAFTRLNEKPVRGLRFVDETVNLEVPTRVGDGALYRRRVPDEQIESGGRPYPLGVHAYRVRAVNALEVPGGPSPAVFTIPAAPEQVFSSEEGDACRLKWRANPGPGIAGYRVYRLDGRWDRDPISRLTPEVLDGTRYRDAAAGDSTRRYHIVAVDSLGQEGFPSSPVWYRREWQRYYEPFTGEWHQ